MKANGKVIKYGDNIDTDVIIPARYLNTTDHKELASHCMEDIDKEFVNKVKDGDIMVGRCKLRLRFIKRTRTYRYKSKRYFMCNRKGFCKNFLS